MSEASFIPKLPVDHESEKENQNNFSSMSIEAPGGSMDINIGGGVGTGIQL